MAMVVRRLLVVPVSQFNENIPCRDQVICLAVNSDNLLYGNELKRGQVRQ